MAHKRRVGTLHLIHETNEGNVTLNATTATTVVAANSDRVALWVSSDAVQAIAVRLRPASADNDKTGVLMQANGPPIKIIGGGDVYTGEVSAILDVGTGTIHFTEM